MLPFQILSPSLHEGGQVLPHERLAGRLPLALEVDVVGGQPLDPLMHALDVLAEPKWTSSHDHKRDLKAVPKTNIFLEEVHFFGKSVQICGQITNCT